MKWISFLLSALLALIASAHLVIAQGGADGNRLVIVLQSEASIDDSLIYLEQIAKVEGGSAELRRRVAKLDIAEFNLRAARVAVSSDQVKFRLLLSGVAPAQFKLAGAKHALVTGSNEPITARMVLAKAESALRQKYPNDDVMASVASLNGYGLPLIELRPTDRVQLDAKANGPGRAGKVRVDVDILVNGKVRDSVAVHVELALADPIVKEGPKEFGILQAGNIAPGLDSRAVIVKRADSVRIVAKIGTVRIEAKGEALQDGKTGDLIRVRNIDSSIIVLGRVDGRGIVLVDD